MIEEERRLLYVAMTRARNELHLCAPLKYAVTQQPKDGDAHVYGAKSRFMTDKVLECFERIDVPQRARRREVCAAGDASRRSTSSRNSRKCGERATHPVGAASAPDVDRCIDQRRAQPSADHQRRGRRRRRRHRRRSRASIAAPVPGPRSLAADVRPSGSRSSAESRFAPHRPPCRRTQNRAGRPVSRSLMSLTESTLPWRSNRLRTSSSVAVNGRLPT